MADISVLAGDFAKSVPGQYMLGSIHLARDGAWTPTEVYIIRNDVTTLELANEESVVKVGGALGWGVAGALVAGPLGLVAGAVLGGRGQKVAFVAEFCDGKKVMAQCDKSTWTKMLADKFEGPDPKVKPRAERSGASHGGSAVITLVIVGVLMLWLFTSCANAG